MQTSSQSIHLQRALKLRTASSFVLSLLDAVQSIMWCIMEKIGIKNSTLCIHLFNGRQPNFVNTEKFKLGPWRTVVFSVVSLCVTLCVSRACSKLQLFIFIPRAPLWALGLFQTQTGRPTFRPGRAEALYGGQWTQESPCCARLSWALMSPDRAAAKAQSP